LTELIQGSRSVATLYEGDCLDIIAGLPPVDSVVTDPPYGIEDIVGGYSRSGATIMNDRNLDVTMGALAAAAMGPAGDAWFFVFYSCRISPTFFASLPRSLTYYGEIAWDKKAPGMGRGIRYQHENISVLYSGEPKKFAQDTMSVITKFREPDVHPHQKPVGLMHRLIEIIGARSVLDPFMGSGSTGAAALRAGVNFTGIELDPDHYRTAVMRISEEATRPDMFALKGANVVQLDLISDNENNGEDAA
jgi:DNA modification methylase